MERPRTDTPDEAHSDPVEWLEDHGDALFGFAIRRIQRHDVAEDLVQETLLAGIRSMATFDRRSSVRTWLIGILKNKITDYFRREAARESKVRRSQRGAAPAGVHSELSQRNGQWIRQLSQWSTNPYDNLERSEFWEVFESCLGKLPATLKAVFILREMDDEPADTICQRLDISKSNLSVRLYRARLNLRICIEQNWFHHK